MAQTAETKKRAVSPAINIAGPADEAALISVLTLAFSSDPMARWSQPDPRGYLENFPLFVKAFGGNALDHGTAYFADGYTGAALWLPPGIGPDERTLAELVESTSSDTIKPDLYAIFEQMEKYHPKEPHWYLPMIGVDPSQQGNGVGSALMEYALVSCDREGLPAYLESSNPENISLY
ncbi:MAG TPA: GNAT family N-acetyltransferase, partial [Pyrinomonadaceae bacterium]|nr:GNAT family N-acetyltransferase [Pyrinomonadaceae bacterium]